MDATSVAPALALLMALPFPRHMRAGDDGLDTIFDIADPRVLPAEYVAGRRAAVEQFRAGNRAALARWLGPSFAPSWTSLYRTERAKQDARLAVGVVFLGLTLAGIARLRRLRARDLGAFLLWSGLTIACTLAAYAALRGSLDMSSINGRSAFIRSGLSVCGAVGLVSIAAHWLALRDRNRLLGDEITLVSLLGLATASHLFVYGWPLGFPLPGPGMLFFPFFAPLVVVTHACLGAILCVISARTRPTPPEPCAQ
jgi:hypothetical protein